MLREVSFLSSAGANASHMGTAQCFLTNWLSVTPAPIAAVDEIPPVTVLSKLSA